MKRLLASVLLIALLAGVGLAAAPTSARAGRFDLQLATQPSPPMAGENQFLITVTDGGKPLAGAGVSVHVDMVDMPMPADFQAAPGSRPGEYAAQVNLSMAGKWRVTVAVEQMAGMKMAGDGEASFRLETGKGITATGGSRSLPWPALPAGVILLVLVGVLLRYRHNAGVRGVVAGLLTLGVVLVGTVYVVNRYRDPTVATVVGSATMDMDAMQAAPGTVAVEVEQVHRGPFQGNLTYTGAVAPDAEEDIYPRVMGRISYLPFYPGDRVSRGQVVARLEAAELAASARGAAGGLQAAQADLSAAEQQTQEAASGIGVATAAVEQAREAVSQAQGEVATAQADVTYWKAEVARADRLYKVGAIAREELDRETAQAATADAKLAQAQAGERAARLGVTRAQQELAQAHARRSGAQAAVSAARGRVQEARGASAQAATMRGYTELRASAGGVVTARNVAPGVVVQPGTSLLKLARIEVVRLQANVSEADLGSVRVGQRMIARTAADPGHPVTARISAIFPARDAATRTSVVEARTPNPGLRLRPGQYLTVELETGDGHAAVLSVPNSALVQRDGASAVFVARKEGVRTIARRVTVTTGTMGNERTEILSGLAAGDQVITSGQANLHDGDAASILPPQEGAGVRIQPPPGREPGR